MVFYQPAAQNAVAAVSGSSRIAAASAAGHETDGSCCPTAKTLGSGSPSAAPHSLPALQREGTCQLHVYVRQLQVFGIAHHHGTLLADYSQQHFLFS